eukprot:s3415_g1.t2
MAASPVFPAGEPNDALTPDRINERFAELEAPQGCFNDVDADSGTPSMMAEVQGPLWVTMDSEDRWLPSGGEEGSFPRPKSTFHCRAPPKRRDPTSLSKPSTTEVRLFDADTGPRPDIGRPRPIS